MLALVVLLEKLTPFGRGIALVAGVACADAGVAMLFFAKAASVCVERLHMAHRRNAGPLGQRRLSSERRMPPLIATLPISPSTRASADRSQRPSRSRRRCHRVGINKSAGMNPSLSTISYNVTLATQPAVRFSSSAVLALSTRHQSGALPASRISFSQSLALSAPQEQHAVVMPRSGQVRQTKKTLVPSLKMWV